MTRTPQPLSSHAHDVDYLLAGDDRKPREAEREARIDPDWLAREVGRVVRGHDEPVSRIARQVAISFLCTRPAPRTSTLLVGPSGSGKTLMADTFTKVLQRRLVRIEGGQFNSQYYNFSMFGAPDGYSGDKDGILIRSVRMNPDTDINFAEIDKAFERGAADPNSADTSLQGNLLTLLKDGTLRHARTNEEVSFRKSLIWLDSNVAYEAFAEQHENARTQTEFRRAAAQILLNKGWRREFVNRIANIFYVPHPGPDVERDIIALEISRMVQEFAWQDQPTLIARGGIESGVIDEIVRMRREADASGFHGAVEDLRWDVGLKLGDLKERFATVRVFVGETGAFDVAGVEPRPQK